MNFFQTIFADDPDPSESESEAEASSLNQLDSLEQEQENASETSGAWSFGVLMKTLTIKSESVIETYRKDLLEFGSGIKKEIEVAQGSLGTVGHAIDELGSSVMKGTAQIISQGKDVLLTVASDNSESDSASGSALSDKSQARMSSTQYSRFDIQILSIQGDPSTFADEPEDAAEYEKWQSEFDLEDKRNEMGTLLQRNVEMENLYRKMVPVLLDEDKFWFRYYFKVHKLKLAEDIRAKIVKRAISGDEEELSWDFDDEEVGEDGNNEAAKTTKFRNNEEDLSSKEDESIVVKSEDQAFKNEVSMNVEVKESPKEDSNDSTIMADEEDVGARNTKSSNPQVDGNVAVDDKLSPECSKLVEVGQFSDNVVVDTVRNDQKPVEIVDVAVLKGCATTEAYRDDGSKDGHGAKEEEDLGWDEIEDMSGFEEKKGSESGGGSNMADLKKRLSVAEEEDLSWDIEEDDDNAHAKH